jgi:butyryl-CoA dehydrogenase
LAIQVLGGAGYTNEHPVELMYRDNRLNPIHEGTTGIQSLDLLARKVPQNGLAGYMACVAAIENDQRQAADIAALNDANAALGTALGHLKRTTESLLGGMAERNIDLVLANSVRYLELFGHVVIGWMWLKQGLVAARGLQDAQDAEAESFYRGKLQAMDWFARWELPQTAVWADLLCDFDDTTYAMQADWF